MGLFGKKAEGNSAEEMQNWYNDRYSSVAIQRNFLLFFSLFVAGALLICLIIIKNLQEGKAAAPYLIEYDKKSGYMTIVESKSKKEYTAQQAVKESMLMQYIYHREAPKLTTIEDDMNYVRVTTSVPVYNNYTSNISKDISALRTAGQFAKFEIKVNSMSYLAANRVSIKITKNLVAEDKVINTMDYNIIASFNFADIEMPIDDLRLNPLGFQITNYRINAVKTFKSSLLPENDKEEDKKNEAINNNQSNKQINNADDDDDDDDENTNNNDKKKKSKKNKKDKKEQKDKKNKKNKNDNDD